MSGKGILTIGSRESKLIKRLCKKSKVLKAVVVITIHKNLGDSLNVETATMIDNDYSHFARFCTGIKQIVSDLEQPDLNETDKTKYIVRVTYDNNKCTLDWEW